MRLKRILPAAIIAAALSWAGDAPASANVMWCMSDPPLQVSTPGDQTLSVNIAIYMPPNQQHLARGFSDTATVASDGHGGTLVTVDVEVPSGVSSAYIVSSVNRYQVSASGTGQGGTVVTMYLDVPAT
jgi:hypothetical protein